MRNKKSLNKYTYKKSMIESVKRLNEAFSNDPKLETSEYILTGYAILNFYKLTNFTESILTINIADTKRKETVYKVLSKYGFHEDKNILILKRRSKEIINESKNNVKIDKFGTRIEASLVSLEKLFIEIDNFKTLPDEYEKAIKKLKDQIDRVKFLKLTKLYKNKKRKISKESQEHLDVLNRKDIKTFGDSNLIDENEIFLKELQQDLKHTPIIQMGGIAVKEFTVTERYTEGIDGFINRNSKEEIINFLNKKYKISIPKVKESKDPYIKNNVTSIKVTKSIINKNEITTKIDLDHSFKKEGLKKLQEIQALEKTENGIFIRPEMLIISKLKAIFQTTNKKNKNYGKRMIKDVLDITNIDSCNEIDFKVLKKIFKNILKITDWNRYFDFSKKEIILNILKSGISFRENYKNTIKVFKMKHLLNEPDVELFENLLKTIEPLIEQKKSQTEISR